MCDNAAKILGSNDLKHIARPLAEPEANEKPVGKLARNQVRQAAQMSTDTSWSRAGSLPPVWSGVLKKIRP